MSYSDGTFTSLTQDGKARVSMPLAQDGSNAEMTERDYVILPANFSPTLPTYSITDPDNANAYLVEESAPADHGAGLLGVTRTFHEIPSATTVYTTTPITKPAFPSADFEEYWVDNTTSDGLVNIWGLAEPVDAYAYPTGGTFTVTYKTSTTAALAYNASNAAIAAAINALADVVTDSFTVTVTNTLTSNGGLAISGGTTSTSNWTLNVAGLTPSCVTPSGYVGGFSNFTIYTARAAITYEYGGHGLSAGTHFVRLLNGTTGGGVVVTATYVNADDFTVPNTDPSLPATYTEARIFVRTYTPGTARMRARNVTTYYLPGVTGGISTPDDIPLPGNLANDNELLLAVCENTTGYQDYDADDLGVYMGEIYQQRVTQIDMADL